MRQGHTGTDRRTLSVATGDYAAIRSAGYALGAKLLLVLLAKIRIFTLPAHVK